MSSFDVRDTLRRVADCGSTAEAAGLLAGLSRTQLAALHEVANPTVAVGRRSKAELAADVVHATVGYRLRAAAVCGAPADTFARPAFLSDTDLQDAAGSAADSAESPPAGLVVRFGPRSAEQAGYDLVWEAGQGRAEDWTRRHASLPGREVAMLTVAEDRPPLPAHATGTDARDWSGSGQEEWLRLVRDPAAVEQDEAVAGDRGAEEHARWASYVDFHGPDREWVDE